MIVDESGSMSVIREQALAGINETLETIKKAQELHKNMEQRVTLITFDSTHTNFIYDNAAAFKTKPLRKSDYRPCGATPLYDAIGMGIAKINAQATEKDTVLVTIITDGEENCSREYDLKMVKNLIEKQKKQGWTFALIGTDNLDVEAMAHDMGIRNHLQFTENAEGALAMFARERRARLKTLYRMARNQNLKDGDYFNLDEE